MTTTGLRRMAPRDPTEAHRAASPLELLFDLVFVVAVGFAATNLHEIEAEGHVTSAIVAYAFVFFAIWWAWINFTWFATSFDTDDWLCRVLTILQMGGVLVLAAGVEPAFADGDFRIVTAGYVVMRLAMVVQWLRASRRAGPTRQATLVYAGGIAVVQVLWVAALALPEVRGPAGISGGIIAIGVRLARVEPRIKAASLFAGSYVPRSILAEAREVSIPVHVLLQWDDRGNDRQAALELFDAFGSQEKTLQANLGGHTGIPPHAAEDAGRFLVRHLL